MSRQTWGIGIALAAAALAAGGCKKSAKPPEPTGENESQRGDASGTPGSTEPTRIVETADGAVLAIVEPSGDANLLHPSTEVSAERAEFVCPGDEAFEPTAPDPQPNFTMNDLYALFPDMQRDKVPVQIKTEGGDIQCEVWPAVAPQAVAMFLGLATGARAWWHPCKHEWVTGEPYYDETTFHSVEPTVKIEAGCLFRGCESAAGFPTNLAEAGAAIDKPGLMVMPRKGNGGVFGLLDCNWVAPEPTKLLEGRCEFQPAARALSSDWVAFGECPHPGLSGPIYRLARVAPDRRQDPHAIHWLRAVSPTTEYYRYRPGGAAPADGGTSAPAPAEPAPAPAPAPAASVTQ
jgi:cyclophilin family peptidyl-prolyl cis-trans isomerase